MATKLTFVFQSGTAGWTESYYKDVSPSPGVVLGLPWTFWRGFFRPRGMSTVCVGVRLSDADVPRAGTFVGVNKRRSNSSLPISNVGDDPPSMAAELSAAATVGRRTIIVRGLRDFAYTRDSAGVYTPDADADADFIAFASALTSAGFCLRHLLPSGGLNTDRAVVSLSSGDGEGKTTLVSHLPATERAIVGQRVIFHRLPSGIFPGLRSLVPVTSSIDGAFTLPVRWTGPTSTVITPGAKWRYAGYNYFTIVDATLKDLREHRTGRPSGLSRGRRSATVYRSR